MQYALSTHGVIVTTQHFEKIDEEDGSGVAAGLVESYEQHFNYAQAIVAEIASFFQKYEASRVHWEQMLRMTLTTLGLAEEKEGGES